MKSKQARGGGGDGRLQGTACGSVPFGITSHSCEGLAAGRADALAGGALRQARGRDAACLGRHFGAPLSEPAFLPGVGPLLPAWRHLASVIAPVLHQVCRRLPTFFSLMEAPSSHFLNALFKDLTRE